MNNKTLLTTVGSIAIMLGVGLYAGSVSAQRFEGLGMGPKIQQPQQQEVLQAIENNDFNTWKELMESNKNNNPLLGQITAENFSDFVTMHTLMKEGKFEEAKVIAEKLGIPALNRMGKGPIDPLTEAERTELENIIRNKDYNAWKTFIESHANAEEPKILELITEENFSRYADMRILMMDARGLMQQADEIRTELGLPQRGGIGHGKGMGKGRMGPHPMFQKGNLE